jgi:hypothetical protein
MAMATGNCEHMAEQLHLQVGEAAEVPSCKKMSLAGAIYLSNVVSMPSALYRLKLSNASGEQIDRTQSPLRQAIAKKAHIMAAHTINALYGGYMGCGWKRWQDEAGIERLRILQMAWQERGSVFAKAMRGAVCGNSDKTVARQILYTGVPVCWG